MEELIIKIIFVIIMLVGAVGAVVPVLPGALLSFGALLLARILHFSELSWWVIGIFGFLTILGIVLDYIVPVAATKKMGGSRYGIWGLIIGLIIGIVFSPFGFISIIIAPFFGAFLGELIYDYKNGKRAFKAASGAIIGYLLTSGYGVLISSIMVVVFLFYDVISD
ncbi:MAG: DUF456 domain-containing protein [Moheibacter sp.]